jgi:hypothetical protein
MGSEAFGRPTHSNSIQFPNSESSILQNGQFLTSLIILLLQFLHFFLYIN